MEPRISFKEAARRLKNFVLRRRGAYQDVFIGPRANVVLQDLASFCRANKTIYTKDDRASYILEGRRQVWLRITDQLRLTQDELWQLYKDPKIEE